MASDYLISENHICISPDLVYYRQNHTTGASLCYCPLEHVSYGEQLQSIVEYLLSVVDHRKTEVTRVCYEMYEVTERSLFTIADLLSVIGEDKLPMVEEHHREISEEEILTSRSCPSTLHQDALYPWIALCDSGGFFLPCALIVARAQSRPFTQMTRRWKHG